MVRARPNPFAQTFSRRVTLADGSVCLLTYDFSMPYALPGLRWLPDFQLLGAAGAGRGRTGACGADHPPHGPPAAAGERAAAGRGRPDPRRRAGRPALPARADPGAGRRFAGDADAARTSWPQAWKPSGRPRRPHRADRRADPRPENPADRDCRQRRAADRERAARRSRREPPRPSCGRPTAPGITLPRCAPRLPRPTRMRKPSPRSMPPRFWPSAPP